LQQKLSQIAYFQCSEGGSCTVCDHSMPSFWKWILSFSILTTFTSPTIFPSCTNLELTMADTLSGECMIPVTRPSCISECSSDSFVGWELAVPGAVESKTFLSISRHATISIIQVTLFIFRPQRPFRLWCNLFCIVPTTSLFSQQPQCKTKNDSHNGKQCRIHIHNTPSFRGIMTELPESLILPLLSFRTFHLKHRHFAPMTCCRITISGPIP